MNRIRDDFFTRSTFSSNQNGGRAWGHLLDHARDTPHFGAGVDDVPGTAIAQLLAQLAIFTRQILLLRSLFDRAQQLRFLHRLRDEVVGAFFDGLNSDLHRTVTGDHDDFDILPQSLRALQKLDTIHDGQAKIRHENVDGL